MLSNTYLQKLGIKYQTTDLNLRREYAQHVLLSYLYQQPQAADLFFKGGTALRLLFRSPRFSEDLDFDTTVHDEKVWESALENTLIDVSREGMSVDIDESKVTSGGYLGIIKVRIETEIVIHFEISFRKNQIAGEVFTVENDFVPPYSVKSLATEQLVEGKLDALFDRQKARDFYDLYFMLRANIVAIQQKHRLQDVLTLLDNKNISFDKELLVFLPRNQHLIIKDFKNSLQRELRRAI